MLSRVHERKHLNWQLNLRKITENTGYQLIQINGQRVYQPSSTLKITPPPKGCEVFIGKLNRNIFEDELIPLFERVGPLYKFRLMMDFLEKNRGYAFATYYNAEDAKMAINLLHNYKIRPNNFIGVYKSLDNCRLFFGNLPTDKTVEDIHEMLSNYVDGITDIIMHPNNKQSNNLNRGYVFVEFEDHRMAAMARRQFSPNNLIAWGRHLNVDWAEPEPDVDPDIMATVTTLILRNLPRWISKRALSTTIYQLIDPKFITKIYKRHCYAFAHFINRSSAEQAVGILKNNLHFEGYRVIVDFSRPPMYSKTQLRSMEPDNFCLSVPPNQRRMVRQKFNKMLNNGSNGNSLDSRSGSGQYAF